MKILFVSSGNSPDGISPIIRNQGKSLINENIEIDYFAIKGKGFGGYVKNIFKLKTHLCNNKYNIIHAHYSITAIVASLAGSSPLVVSLMGSDVKGQSWFNIVLRAFNKLFWDMCIVKSEDMKSSSGLKRAHIIPNGVDLDRFKPLDRQRCWNSLGWSNNKTHIIFPGNPDRFEKNFNLAKQACNLLTSEINHELHYIQNIQNSDMPVYFNASDLVLLTSLWEGSPNVIKEAMACNCPIVSTDVGDVSWVFGNTEGCYITSYNPENVAESIRKALCFGKRTKGRERIKQLGLDSESVAKKIIAVYNKVLSR